MRMADVRKNNDNVTMPLNIDQFQAFLALAFFPSLDFFKIIPPRGKGMNSQLYSLLLANPLTRK